MGDFKQVQIKATKVTETMQIRDIAGRYVDIHSGMEKVVKSLKQQQTEHSKISADCSLLWNVYYTMNNLLLQFVSDIYLIIFL